MTSRSAVPPSVITDPTDARLDDYRHLNDPARRRQMEHEDAFFIVEGTLAVARLCEPSVAGRWQPRSLLVTEPQWDRLATQWRAAFAQVPVFVVPLPVMRETVGFNLHRGVVAAVDRPPAAPVGDTVRRTDGSRPVVLAEGLVDHENVGALFRNAAAFGAGAVLLDRTCADPLYRRAVRVSMGHVLAVPFSQGLDVVDLVRSCHDHHRTVVALVPSAPRSLWDLAPDPSVALMVGSEGPGLTGSARDAADVAVAIPMADEVDSLNVATALAVALAAVTR